MLNAANKPAWLMAALRLAMPPTHQLSSGEALVPRFTSFATIRAACLKPARTSAQAKACGSLRRIIALSMKYGASVATTQNSRVGFDASSAPSRPRLGFGSRGSEYIIPANPQKQVCPCTRRIATGGGECDQCRASIGIINGRACKPNGGPRLA